MNACERAGIRADAAHPRCRPAAGVRRGPEVSRRRAPACVRAGASARRPR
ncbi:hypothetical protein [Lysobacter gummosus]